LSDRRFGVLFLFGLELVVAVVVVVVVVVAAAVVVVIVVVAVAVAVVVFLPHSLASTHPILTSEFTKVKLSLLMQAKQCLDQKPSEAAKTTQKFKETKELMEKILKTYGFLLASSAAFFLLLFSR
jgi:hypothetical protein